MQGGIAAISASTNAAAPIVIDNLAAGVLQNMSGLSTDLAVTTQGGPTTLTNAGTLIGVLRLGAGTDNAIFNLGLWNTAGGASDFGGSATLTNNAGGTILAGGAAATTTTTFDVAMGFDPHTTRLAVNNLLDRYEAGWTFQRKLHLLQAADEGDASGEQGGGR